jgi:two-component system alkaline phosphatase synthesis response regulator PhoP
MGKRILVADDEPYIWRVIKYKLEEDGYDVLVALDGKETLRLLKTENLDLLILDLRLPEITGYEICREIEKDKTLSRIPIIILTGLDEDASSMKKQFKMVRHLMLKPFSPYKLKSTIKEILE